MTPAGGQKVYQPKVATPEWHFMTDSQPLSLREGFLKAMAQMVWNRVPTPG